MWEEVWEEKVVVFMEVAVPGIGEQVAGRGWGWVGTGVLCRALTADEHRHKQHTQITLLLDIQCIQLLATNKANIYVLATIHSRSERTRGENTHTTPTTRSATQQPIPGRHRVRFYLFRHTLPSFDPTGPVWALSSSSI